MDPDEAPHGRGDLAANAGHELKTPLSIILGLSGRLLAATDGGSASHRDVERIRSNAYALVKQVDDLLEAARIEGGRVVVTPADCDVAALVRDLATGFQSLLDERGQHLLLRTPGRLPARIDAGKVGTIVSNLVANAIRYAPPGGVVRCTVARDDERALRLEVADSGPGIPPAEREAVFERFHQIGGPAHRRPGGTGLGLAIVRELTTILRGTVTAGTAPEGGALFTVRLPHEPAAATAGSPGRRLGIELAERERVTIEALRLELEALDRRAGGPRPRTDGQRLPRVLVVEPGATLGEYLEELLAAEYEVHRATTADEARAVGATTELDAAIVDVGTAGGETLLEAMRRPELGDVPVLVLAGDARQGQELVRGRAHDYAVTPFAEALLVRLGALVGRRRAESARAEADARFRALFEHAPTGMALATANGRLLEVNAALARLLGLTRAAPLELTLDDVTHPDDLLAEPRTLVPPAAGDGVLRLERRLVAAGGRVVDATLTVSAIRDGTAPRQIVVQVEESRPAPRTEDMLASALGVQLARCVRYGERAALLLVEVDELDFGDTTERLRTAAAVAGAMRRRLRRSDALLRPGERRFAAVLVKADAPSALAVARSVRHAIEETPAGDLGPLHATVGVCAFDHSATPGSIVAAAECALRRAGLGGGVGTAAA